MAYFTDKAFSSRFLDKSKGLEDMIVQNEATEKVTLDKLGDLRLSSKNKSLIQADRNTTVSKTLDSLGFYGENDSSEKSSYCYSKRTNLPSETRL